MAVSGIGTVAKKAFQCRRPEKNSGGKNLKEQSKETKRIKKPLKNWAGKFLLSGNVRQKDLKKLLIE